MFHGTTVAQAERFLSGGIDGNLLFARQISGPQDLCPGIFVSPRLSVARRFGNCTLQIDGVEESELAVPPTLNGMTLQQSLSWIPEPQALLHARIEPERISVVESYPKGVPFNPFEVDSDLPYPQGQ
jgi:hypothetical protein